MDDFMKYDALLHSLRKLKKFNLKINGNPYKDVSDITVGVDLLEPEAIDALVIFKPVAVHYNGGTYPLEKADAPGKAFWKCELSNGGWADHICSNCGFTETTDIHVKLEWKYCPYCGSEMEDHGK